ncbi:hypothetical protein [Xenorhabdus bovienii]|uniref:hypothetical protein n=1 Tax=Xenorhabdus bovienii TaxID=40576 RepID=UPI0023B29331|nr:hypothetical protein [Xenorhabdus bovienii]MDE9430793.1 hypothetical protein [Xenorhabdus bovienii]MDE9441382.1 hypothetical protein [Xenorhabdus bovienii]MDE9457612.1 hypothetical protein [Xenorhabdus bovienii]MDE9488436.1 hypothetical protein [Xenorhabdus bovienii]MDE9504815.1 hypothetical protein [Xenorhabdus bovienii]
MPFDFKKTAEEKMRSVQPSHSTDKDRDSATSDIGWDSNDMLRNGSVSLDQAKDPTFWKENIADYYKWMLAVKEELKMLDLSLKAMESPESAAINTAKNVGITALQAGLSTGSSAAGTAIGGAIGTALFPGIGTILGMGVGAGVGLLSGLGLNILSGIAIDKLKYKLEIAHPYPKTKNMIFAINNYDKNPITNAIKKKINKGNRSVTGGSTAISTLVGQVSPIKLPVYELADLAVSHNRSAELLKNDKAQHILDVTNYIREVLNESHSDAVMFMRKNYGDSGMSLPGVAAKIKGSKLTLDTMARAKNKIDIRTNSIDRQVKKLSRLNTAQ